MGKFVITVRKNGEFQFNLKAANGQVVLSSEGYTKKESCLNGIESVRKNSQDPSKFEVKVAKNGKPFFNLKATKGQVIGASQMYASEATLKKGIASVAANAPTAPVVEEIYSRFPDSLEKLVFTRASFFCAGRARFQDSSYFSGV